MNKHLFNYDDVDIYERDIQTLEDGNWLNSSIINFHIKHNLLGISDKVSFEGNAFKPIRKTQVKKKYVCLDPIAISFICMQYYEDEDLNEILDGMGLGDKETLDWIILPITDQDSLSSPSTHWSCLLYSSKLRLGFHFDSNVPHNLVASERITMKLGDLLFGSEGGGNIGKVIQSSNPQQKNGYDCGIFTLMFMESLARVLEENMASNDDFTNSTSILIAFESALQNITPDDAKTCRMKLKSQIRSLASKISN